jgi:rhodanese-related sulfurtransferase
MKKNLSHNSFLSLKMILGFLMNKYNKFFLVFSLFVFLSLSSTQTHALPVIENGFKQFIDENGDSAVIIDIRWPEVYNDYHIKGAYLINSGGTDEVKRDATDSILATEGVTEIKSTPIGLYCNCGDGHEASRINAYLEGKGFDNIVWLSHSISEWKDFTYLVSGSTREGDGQLTQAPSYSSSGGFFLDPILIAVIGLGVVTIIGIYFFFQSKSSSQDFTQSAIKNADRKKAKELDNLSKLLENRKSPIKETQKKNVRRR